MLAARKVKLTDHLAGHAVRNLPGTFNKTGARLHPDNARQLILPPHSFSLGHAVYSVIKATAHMA